MDDIKSIYQPELARHAAEVLERVVIASFSDASEYFIGTGVTAVNDYTSTTAAATMTLVELRKIGLTLKNYRRKGHSKFGGKPVVVMHPNVMEDLLDDQDLVDKLLVPGNDNTPIKNGSLQQYKAYGMYFVETLVSEVVASTGTGTPNVYTSYMLGKDPYVVIGLGSGKITWHMTGFVADKSDVLAQKATFGYKMWAGAKVIDPIAITKIYSKSSYDIVADFSGDAIGNTVSQA
jgi:N4-gp56 family major capsid protein